MRQDLSMRCPGVSLSQSSRKGSVSEVLTSRAFLCEVEFSRRIGQILPDRGPGSTSCARPDPAASSGAREYSVTDGALVRRW